MLEPFEELGDTSTGDTSGDTSSEIFAVCDADINGDGVVDSTDESAVHAAWGVCTGPCPEDINDDGVVDALDLLAVNAAWGVCPS